MGMPPQTKPPVTLLESGWLAPAHWRLSPLFVRRGMAVRTCDDCQAGHVAALVMDCNQQLVTHLLLMRHCWPLEYHLLPVSAITGVSEDEVTLAILQQGVTTLPRWPST